MPRLGLPRLTGTAYTVNAKWWRHDARRRGELSPRIVIVVRFRLSEKTVRMPPGADLPIVNYATLIDSTLLAGQAERLIDVLRRGTHGTQVTLDEEGTYFTEPMPVTDTPVMPTAGTEGV